MALAGLVADYSDSSDDDDAGSLTLPSGTKQSSTDYFTGTGTQSDSSDSNDDPTGAEVTTLAQTDTILPNPLASGAGGSLPPPDLSSTGTVFGNRFADQEKAELAIFEKHVKMTEDRTSTRPPCFKFKRGACRKGNGCRFSHDLGFQAPSKASESLEASATPTEPPEQSLAELSSQVVSSKKRVGITNTLRPAKKAKRALDGQRSKERPWTVGHHFNRP